MVDRHDSNRVAEACVSASVAPIRRHGHSAVVGYVSSGSPGFCSEQKPSVAAARRSSIADMTHEVGRGNVVSLFPTAPGRYEPPATPPRPPRATRGIEPLWREATGRVLRRHRHEREERLADVAERAGVSTQYLSEIERGQKDASSEVLAAVAGGLGLTLLDLTTEVASDLHSARVHAVGRPSGPLALAA